MSKLNDAVIREDWEVIRGLLHQIKPSFTLIGFPTFTQKIQEVEKSSTQSMNKEKLEDIQTLISEIQQHVFEVVQKWIHV